MYEVHCSWVNATLTNTILCCRTCEAVLLLSLSQGSAQLLMSVLNSTKERLTEQNMADSVKALDEMKVHTLSPSQAYQILRRRIYIEQ